MANQDNGGSNWINKTCALKPIMEINEKKKGISFPNAAHAHLLI